MQRRLLTTASILLALIAIGVVGIVFALNQTIESGSGPVHRFPLLEGETFLTDERAAAIGREVMNRDGFPEAEWKLASDDRSKAPNGRPDQFLTRNTIDPNQGYVSFYSGNSARFVSVELRDGTITAAGSLGK